MARRSFDVAPPPAVPPGAPLPPLRHAGAGSAAAGWYPDPWRVARQRWWDGLGWSGQTGGAAAAPSPLPFTVVPWTIAVTVASLVGSRLVLEALGTLRLPVLVYVAIALATAYGPLVGWVVVASRRWGSGSLGRDVGFRARPIDLGWGVVVWLSALGVQIGVLVVVSALGLPIASNTEGIEQLRGERGVLIALLVTAVIAAPFVEELVFRGLLLRGLAARMSWPIAVAVQGGVFGLAHVDPSRGAGNVGLVLVLGAVGTVFGGAAVLLGRIGPTIVAHMVMNGVVMTVVLAVGG